MIWAEAEGRLAGVFMLTRVEVDFGVAECAIRMLGTGELRTSGRSRWPTYDPTAQFELTLVARGVRQLRFMGELAGRGLEGIHVESLAGRQLESLRWRVLDMEASVFAFSCDSLQVDGVSLDADGWSRK